MNNKSSNFTDSINQLFKLRNPGSAYCKCCHEFLIFYKPIKIEIIDHFKIASHVEFQTNQIINWTAENQERIMNSEIYIKEILENLYIIVKDREAYCLWCNENIIITDSLEIEFIEHFKTQSHKQFLVNQLSQVQQIDADKNQSHQIEKVDNN